ncbi:hypothetical protein FHS82_002145 [Pseudochelatococcus lubricantis]|uniref:Uncharacterized protein n=1 Tax=Pseudochelatococcus lubricantis TaxID=1538102 RepID=A0ABX0V104_9HYPH|nr:hypothetical protein [Pseudochelatococcus lubricantis]
MLDIQLISIAVTSFIGFVNAVPPRLILRRLRMARGKGEGR